MKSERVVDTLTAFGRALADARRAKSYSPGKVANQAGMSVSLYAGIESGSSCPSASVFKRLSGMFPTLKHWNGALVSYRQTFEPAAETPATPLEKSFPAAFNPPRLAFEVALRHARTANGLSMAQLAELLDVTSGAVGFWESGEHAPILDHLKKLQDLFPALLEAEPPRARDITKPVGRVGAIGASGVSLHLVPDPSPLPSEPPAALVSGEAPTLPPEEPPTMVPAAPTTALAHTAPTSLSSARAWLATLRRIKASPDYPAVRGLLLAGRVDGATIDDLLEMLEES